MIERNFTTYCDVTNYDIEIEYQYWAEGDEMEIQKVMMGSYDVTLPFMKYCLDELSEAVWQDIRQ